METVSEMGPEAGAKLLTGRSAEEIAKLLQEIPSDDAAALIDYLPEELSREVLELMRRRESGQVESLLEYGEQTAGRIMNPQVFALSEDLTVGEAITALQSSRDVEMVFYLYVVDGRRHLVGVTSLRRLLLVSPETPLKRIMTPEVTSVRVDTDQEEVARQVASYNLLAVPVVDEENKLVGIVTVDDVIDVIKDEASEDLLRLAGVSGDDSIATPAAESLRKRLPWLAINLGTAFVAASVVALFEGTIQQVTALAIFMPIVAGMGGNAATQTLTVIVRALALGELSWDTARKALMKESLVGLGNGIALGIVAAAIAWLFKGEPMLGLLLGMAMVVNMFVAATAGTLVPLGLKALKVDPALASSVFITTFTDVVGFASFLGLATVFLRYLVKVQ
jgi:magnesium transporter